MQLWPAQAVAPGVHTYTPPESVRCARGGCEADDYATLINTPPAKRLYKILYLIESDFGNARDVHRWYGTNAESRLLA